VAQERIKKWGHPPGAQCRKTIFLVVPLHFFGFKGTISRFGERFRDGKCILVSISYLLFLYSRCPRAQPL